MIPKLEFGSLFTYVPQSRWKNATQLNMMRYELEQAHQMMCIVKGYKSLESEPRPFHSMALLLSANLNNFSFAGFFNPDMILVPMPSRSMKMPDSLWIPKRIASEMEWEKLGRSFELLKRVKEVPKSTGQTIGSKRPPAHQHSESFSVQKPLDDPKEITLIDDVTTTGATFLGGADALTRAFPNVRIRAFALLRTISNPNDFKEMLCPRVGTISYHNGKTYRRP